MVAVGFFDFLFKPKVNTPHHYVFAHRVLRDLAFREPLRTIECLSRGDRVKFLNLVLDIVDSLLPNEPPRRFRGKHIRITTIEINGDPCVILEMPPATTSPEAHFIALLGRRKDPAADSAEHSPLQMDLHYFTLEKTDFESAKNPSVFCGWLADGTHLNFGAGSPPTLKHFIAFLQGWFAGPRHLAASSRPPS